MAVSNGSIDCVVLNEVFAANGDLTTSMSVKVVVSSLYAIVITPATGLSLTYGQLWGVCNVFFEAGKNCKQRVSFSNVNLNLFSLVWLEIRPWSTSSPGITP